MKNIRLTTKVLVVVFFTLLTQIGFSQTGSYSCNVVYSNDINQPLTGVKVDLYDSGDNFIATTFTGDDGYFTFDNLTIGNEYTAKTTYDAEANDVDLADAYILLGYLYGDVELTENQLLAADVDGNNNINVDDFWYLVDEYYVNELPFPVGSWVANDWTFTMEAGKMRGGPMSVEETGNFTDDPTKDATNIQIDYTSEILNLNKEGLNIPIYINENIITNGVGLVLSYNSDAIEIKSIESPIKNMKYAIEDGIIRIGWTDLKTSYYFNSEQALVNIHIKQKANQNDGQIEEFSLLEGTHILDKSGKKYPYVNFSSSKFKLAQIAENTNNLAYPNPCTQSFTVTTNATDGSAANIQLFNTLGQLVQSSNIAVQNQSLVINTEQLKEGIYIYHINNLSKLISGTITVRK